ncbi:hypothetical protein PR002_g8413 [Phytophthora rubi]|uniref:Uncharacterized protein n=2 Tax=Phytophthora rubi TaxID=129364 RepID=A0A6A3MSC1_9STRA|nr:hypothetical protein PR002_g8413 [Phytophthora rubi]
MRSGVMLDSMRRYGPSFALSRSHCDGDSFLSTKSSTSTSFRLVPRSTSSTTSSRSRPPPCRRSSPRGLTTISEGGGVQHSVKPRESSILQYMSIVPPGTHTESDMVLEGPMVSAVEETWVVSRRYSAAQLRTFVTLEREPYRDVQGAFRGGAVSFRLNEMTLLEARPDNVTTLMTIDELVGGYADSTYEEYDFRHRDDNSHISSASDLPSPVYVLEE